MDAVWIERQLTDKHQEVIAKYRVFSDDQMINFEDVRAEAVSDADDKQVLQTYFETIPQSWHWAFSIQMRHIYKTNFDWKEPTFDVGV